MRPHRPIVALLLALAAGCTLRAEIGDAPGELGGADARPPEQIPAADAGPAGNADATPEPPPDAAPVARTLTHSLSPDIVPGNSASCRNDVGHAENSYYRVFDLAAFGIPSAFSVDSVSVSIEAATSGAGTQPLSVALHTLTGPLLVANLTELARTTVAIADSGPTVLEVALPAEVPAGATLVVEVYVPNGQDAGNNFRIGSNGGGQLSPSYLRAPAQGCDLLEPTDLATIGFPDMHLVLSVSGTY